MEPVPLHVHPNRVCHPSYNQAPPLVRVPVVGYGETVEPHVTHMSQDTSRLSHDMVAISLGPDVGAFQDPMVSKIGTVLHHHVQV